MSNLLKMLNPRNLLRRESASCQGRKHLSRMSARGKLFPSMTPALQIRPSSRGACSVSSAPKSDFSHQPTHPLALRIVRRPRCIRCRVFKKAVESQTVAAFSPGLRAESSFRARSSSGKLSALLLGRRGVCHASHHHGPICSASTPGKPC